MKQKKKQLSLNDLEDYLFEDEEFELDFDDDNEDLSYESAMEP